MALLADYAVTPETLRPGPASDDATAMQSQREFDPSDRPDELVERFEIRG